MADDSEIPDIEEADLLKLPLTPAQLKILEDPSNFSFLEEFYILYHPLQLRFHSNSNALISLLRAMGLEDRANEELIGTIGAYKILYFLSKEANMPPISQDKVFYGKEELDPKKLEWGQKLASAIATNKVLQQIWSLRLNELTDLSQIDAIECTEIELKVLVPNRVKHLYRDMLLRKCTVDSEQSLIALKLAEKFRPVAKEYWDRGEICPESAFKSIFDEYNKENKDCLTFLEARRVAVLNKANLQLQELKDTGHSDPDKKQANVFDLEGITVIDLFGDCGDPNCAIHGNKKATEKPNTSLKSVPLVSPDPILKSTVTPIDKSPVTTQLPATIKKDVISMAPADKKTDSEIKFTNVSVQFFEDPSSKKIQLPLGMTLKEGRHWLLKIEEEETRIFQFEYKFTGWFPLDAMWSAYQALAELHGFVHVGDFQGWWGPTPPTMMTIEIGYGKTVQIPWGPIEVSGFSAPLVPSIELVQGLPTLVFSAKIKNNERSIADALMTRTQKHLQEASIYRGKPIEVDFTMFSPNDFRFDPTKAPVFWDVSKTKKEELIFSKEVNDQIRINLFGPIERTAQARKYKIPLRRGVLIDGKYGVGKTLAAGVTAKICSDNGWTFLYLKKLDQLKAALTFAKKYQPCVIFAEDINRITNGKRDADMDALFNTIDGVDRKNDEVMVVFTTNDLEEIHSGMLRPGRIDSVIRVTPPDQFAAVKLVKLYGRGIIDVNANLDHVGVLLNGQIPAIIREAVERAKIAAALDTEEGDDLVVKEEHLILTAKEMLIHADYLKPKTAPKPDLVILGQAIGSVIASGIRYNIDETLSDKEAVSLLPVKVLDEAGRPTNGKNDVTSW